MKPTDADRTFAGSIPQLYEQLLVPLIFAPYADDLSERARAIRPSQVLEVAAGTGVLTRAIVQKLPGASIVASDLNQAMLDHASAIGTARPVTWQQADAMHLPFHDNAFDMVLCQFGAMFFQDKAAAFAEARRVLRPEGTLIFSVWDRIETNEFADVVTTELAACFAQDPPRFLARTPHGYYEVKRITQDLAHGGFSRAPNIDTVTKRSVAESAWAPASAYCQGTPLRNEIEARDASNLERATQLAASAIARRFGDGPVDGSICAHIVTVAK